MSHRRCCCGPPFWRLVPCSCTGGPTNLWTSGYMPEWGCVWANVGGDCFTLCPDGESKGALQAGDVEVDPVLTPVASAAEGCLECCGTPASDCCQWGGPCGLTSNSNPFSHGSWDWTLSSVYRKGVCGDCGQYEWSTFFRPHWVGEQDYDGECEAGISAQDVFTTTVTDPCTNSPGTYTENRSFSLDFDLIPGRFASADYAVGFHSKVAACIGTVRDVPSPYFLLVWAFSGGALPNLKGAQFAFAAAVSMADPSKWWLQCDGVPFSGFGVNGDLVLSGSMTTPGACVGRVDAAFSAVQTVNTPECGGFQHINSASGLVVVTATNLGVCSGSRPSGSRQSFRAAVGPAGAKVRVPVPGNVVGCHSCGGPIEGGSG